LAVVIARHQVQVGLRNFKVVAEDTIETHFERADAGALALPLLEAGKVLLAVAAQPTQFVEFAINPAPYDSAFSQGQRRMFCNGALVALTPIRKIVERAVELLPAPRINIAKRGFEPRQARKRRRQRREVSRGSGLKRYPAEQALEI